MRLPRMVPLPLLMLGALPATGHSQTLSPRAIEDINAAAVVRVRLSAGRQGQLFAPQADSTNLRYGRSRVLNHGGSLVELAPPLAMADVVEIQRPIGSHAGHGAKIGAGIGAGLALLAVIVASSDPWTEPSAGQAVGAIVVWTFMGAGVGALLGGGSKQWETVYRAP